MSTIQEYCKKLSSDQLEQALQEHLTSDNPFSKALVAEILSILSQRAMHETEAQNVLRRFYGSNDPPDIKNDL